MSALLFMATADIVRWFGELEQQGIRITDAKTGSKFVEEVEELLEAARKLEHDASLAEAADCFIALVGAVNGAGWTLDQLAHAVDAKMVINRQRKWERQPNGTFHHVKEASHGG